jgi:plasmid stabilization system protein ParE
MSLFIFPKQAEQDLREIYHHGFLNYGEDQAEMYMSSIKGKCHLLLMAINTRQVTAGLVWHYHLIPQFYKMLDSSPMSRVNYLVRFNDN